MSKVAGRSGRLDGGGSADPEPLVRAHVAWALGRVGSAEASAALSERTSVEPDASVLGELSAAMAGVLETTLTACRLR